MARFVMVSRAGSRAGVDGVAPVLVPPRRVPRGIPSTWHRPTARWPGGSPRRCRDRSCPALPPGRRVVRPFGRSRGCHASTDHRCIAPLRRSGHPRDLPARRGHAVGFSSRGRPVSRPRLGTCRACGARGPAGRPHAPCTAWRPASGAVPGAAPPGAALTMREANSAGPIQWA